MPDYNPNVSTHSYDAIIIGGGIIGLSLALELRRTLSNVLVIDKGAPGRESSYAAAGMLNACDVESPPELAELARRSAQQFPAYIDGIASSADTRIDFNRGRALILGARDSGTNTIHGVESSRAAHFVDEDWVDPRTLVSALLECLLERGVHFIRGDAVVGVEQTNGRLKGVSTTRCAYGSRLVFNCAGAWAGEVAGVAIPSRPVKGQMISLAGSAIDYVVRSNSPDIYMLPRRVGLVAVGATVEEAGFNKSVSVDTAMRLHRAAAELVPALANARMHESWSGLRPAAPDGLPILSDSPLRGYFVAGCHYRNGILLAPITAQVMTDWALNERLDPLLVPFSLARFG